MSNIDPVKFFTDFEYFFENCFTIKDKDFVLEPKPMNRAQRYLWAEIQRQEKAGLPVRIVILKARQLGMSTLVQALLFWRAITNPGSGSLVVSHDEDSASELFGKTELAYRSLPDEIRLDLEAMQDTRKKGKKLAFAGDLNSTMQVDTAGNKSLGRGQTYQSVHLSELAFYDNPDEVMFGLKQAIPRRAGTMIIIESTANGMGNYFHNQWKQANDADSHTSYCPIFLPWTDEPHYSEDIKHFHADKNEKKLKSKYKLTNAQLAWRRITVADECDGDIDKFRQEYPISPEEAFLVTGATYFQRRSLETLTRSVAKKGDYREGSFELHGVQARFEDSDPGPWRIFKEPEEDHSYVIGADPAGGTAADFSAAHVLDAETLEQVASYRGKLDPDEFARELRWAGVLYNKALIAVEKNGEGRATLLKLQKDLEYDRLFYHMTEESWSGGVKNAWGWKTSSVTRPTMLAQLGEIVRKGEIKIPDDRTINEMHTFIRVEGTRVAEHGPGANDDMVMALAIATSSEVRNQAMYHHRAVQMIEGQR